MSRHVIIGSGAIGSAVAAELLGQGHQVTVITRSGRGPTGSGAERVALDATDSEALTSHVRGAATLFNCANPPTYMDWKRQWPPLAASLLRTAERTGAVLVSASNLYGYGPVDGPITVTLPLSSSGTKGKLRAQMWEEMAAAHSAGRIRTAEVRASDYVGGGSSPHTSLLARYGQAVLRGKRTLVFGSADAAHSFTYVPDIARTLAAVALNEKAWGQAWHVPSPEPVTIRQALRDIAEAAAAPAPRISTVPRWALRPGYPFVPLLRELDEVLYQWERPFVMDHSRTTEQLGLQPAAWDQVITDVVHGLAGDSRTLTTG